MKRSTTDSFILTLKLNTSANDEAALWHRMECGRAMYNALIRHAIKAVASLRQDKAYRDALSRRLADKKDKQAVKELSDIREAHGLTEFAFHQYVKLLQKRYAADIDSLTAQKIASRVWNAVRTSSLERVGSCTFANTGTSCPWKVKQCFRHPVCERPASLERACHPAAGAQR